MDQELDDPINGLLQIFTDYRGKKKNAASKMLLWGELWSQVEDLWPDHDQLQHGIVTPPAPSTWRWKMNLLLAVWFTAGMASMAPAGTMAISLWPKVSFSTVIFL